MSHRSKRAHSAIESTGDPSPLCSPPSCSLPSPPSSPPDAPRGPASLEVNSVSRRLRQGRPSHVQHIGHTAPVYLTAVLEALTASFVDAAAREAKRYRGEDEQRGQPAEVADADEGAEADDDGSAQTIRPSHLASLFASHEEWRAMMMAGTAEQLRGADGPATVDTAAPPPPALQQRSDDASANAIFRSVPTVHSRPAVPTPRPAAAPLPTLPPPTPSPPACPPLRSVGAESVGVTPGGAKRGGGGDVGAVDAMRSVGAVRERGGSLIAGQRAGVKGRSLSRRSPGWAGGRMGTAVSCYVPRYDQPHRSARSTDPINPYSA